MERKKSTPLKPQAKSVLTLSDKQERQSKYNGSPNKKEEVLVLVGGGGGESGEGEGDQYDVLSYF